MGNVHGTAQPVHDPIAVYIPQPDDPSNQKQSVLVEGTGDWGSGIHRSPLCVDGLVGVVDPFVTTLYDNFRHGAALSKGGPCFGYRPVKDGVAGEYIFLTYKEVAQWSLEVGSAMRHLGLQRCDNVGIYSKNCVEWVVVEQACNAFTHATVAIYDTFGHEVVQYIINHAELTIVFVETAKLDPLYSAVETSMPTLRTVVCFGDVSEQDVKKFAAFNVTLLSMDQMRRLGQENFRDPDPPKSSDVAILMYTSGTTGQPKGVIITHHNMISTTNAAAMVIKLSASDLYLSFLPLAHCFERIVHAVVLQRGAGIGFYQGDVRKLPDDIKVLKPTLFVGVPRVFNRFYEKVQQAITGGSVITQQVFHRAYAYRKAALFRGQNTPWCNYLLFDKLKAALGGRVRIMISGSAPLDPRVHEFLRVCMCPVVQQGYGLTETCAGTVVQTENDLSVGTIGHPLPANEFKLVDVPELEYRTTDDPPQGELYIRGNSVFQHYFKDPEKTREDKDEDGWFHTGDIGRWNADGSLSIIDRKKNIFKLAQGEYIAVESLEGVYDQSPHVAQVYIYGDSLKPFLLAVVVPEEVLTMEWAKQRGIEGSFSDVCRHPDTRKMLENEMMEEAKKAKLRGFELVKGIIVHDVLFTVDNNLLTPTFKLKRPVAVKVFKEQFDKLYEEIEASMRK